MDYLKLVSQSLRRNVIKLTALLFFGFLAVWLTESYPMSFGETGAPLVRGFGICFLGLAAGFLGLCILDPHVSSQQLVEESLKNNNTAAGLVFVGRSILLALVLILMATSARANQPPAAAVAKLPILKQELEKHWPALTSRDYIGAQIEQETCITLKHSSCWNENAQLLTHREQGVGLGQLTRAFYPDGRLRFDAMAELKARYPKELENLSWESWRSIRLQLRAVVLKDRDLCASIRNAATEKDRMQMCMAAYNGGFGGLSNDRLACRAKPGCDHTRWFGHVEHTSMKSKLRMKGYGRSPFEINREYVHTIERVRRPRYALLNI